MAMFDEEWLQDHQPYLVWLLVGCLVLAATAYSVRADATLRRQTARKRKEVWKQA